MAPHLQIVAPVVALALWTHVVWAWMYAMRIPAIRRSRMVLDPSRPRGAQMAELPPDVRWKGDNYNHLMEEPTVFYAIALAHAVLGTGGGVNLTLAWAYVAVRVVHSLWQGTGQKIEIRFALFATSSLLLMGLTVNVARVAFM
jgi:hypothetical protein